MNNSNIQFLFTVEYSYRLDTRPSINSNTTETIAIIKGHNPISDSQPLHSKLQTILLPSIPASSDAETASTSPYDSIHSVIHYAISPYFEASTNLMLSRTNQDSDSAALVSSHKHFQEKDSMGAVPATRKKFAELELSLLHLQQNIEIPELTLNIHPIIEKAIEQNPDVEPTIDIISPEYLQDTDFLNSLQSNVNGWIKSIQGITRMSRDPNSGTATQEINFWLSMETALKHIEAQLQGPGVSLTLKILRNAKRFHATVSFLSDTGIKEASDKVAKYNQLMRDFPLDELISATTLNRIQRAIVLIFSHLVKKLKIIPYPVWRALALVQGISVDFNNTLQNILGNLRLMHLDYTAFNHTVQQVQEIFDTWDEQFKEFTNIARDVIRKRTEKFIPIRINASHAKTKERIDYIVAFRNRHQELKNTLVKVLRSGQNSERLLAVGLEGVNPIEEIENAYDVLKHINVLDTTEEGVVSWNKAEKEYNERTTRVESAIIVMLRERLSIAKTSNEMFRVFSKFNALFVRPSIRGAIQEYQSRLIENVKADIASLHERFRLQYFNSEAYEMSKLRDIPPVAGSIIWIRQIERQLDTYMKRVEAVLGKGWQYYVEGQKLHSESIGFRQKLDTNPIFEAWLSNITKKNLAISGHLFKIIKVRKPGTNASVYQLSVNFDPQVITLFKEVRHFIWLNFHVPHTLTTISKDAKRVYPYAVNLTDSLKTLETTRSIMEKNSKTNGLLNGYENDVYQLLSKGLSFQWDSFIHFYDVQPTSDKTEMSIESKYVKFVHKLEESVKVLELKSQKVNEIYTTISESVSNLSTCRYDSDSFQSHLIQIQEQVDRLNLEGYVNVDEFVNTINTEIQQILVERTKTIINKWILTFEKPELGADLYVPLRPFVHELILKNSVISLNPPIESARCTWISNFQQNVECVSNLSKIQSNRFDININIHQKTNTSGGVSNFSQKFSDIPNLLKDEVIKATLLIEHHIHNAEMYFDNWYQFQSLWDLQPSQVFEFLGDDMEKWLQILNEIRNARSTFDTAESFKNFGTLRIDFRSVQLRIISKYDTWQQDVMLKFSKQLNTSIRDLCTLLESHRRELEMMNFDISSTDHVVSIVTKVQTCTNLLPKWEREVQLYSNGQTLLSRYRFRFPTNWLYVEQVEAEFSALQEILDKKTVIIDAQIDAIRARVQNEMKRLTERINTLEYQWEQNKPIAGSINPTEALQLLQQFEKEATSLLSSSELLARASGALDLDFQYSPDLEPVIEEIRDFNSVWAALESIWNSLNDLRELPWASIVPRKIRKSLDSLVEVTKGMPTRIRQYAAFEHIQNVLKNLIKSQSIIIDLKTEAIHERHWQRIFNQLCKNNPNRFYNSLTLGDVWDMDLLGNAGFLKDIVAEAQGELALEVFLRQVRQTWANYELQLVNYKNTCRLIKGWNDLFQVCGDHLNSLSAMHHSHYFKVFEEEARAWEEKLNRVHVLFDVWVNVQRQWVYLEGVFNNNSEIKHILPVESSRFQSINSELFLILRKVYKSPLVLDILNIPGIQQSIERLADLLSKVQKALGEYYEQERQRFARFYFIGDDDLLEIIGNSNDIQRVEKHLNKMFAGIHGLIYDKENSCINGVTSKEGEELHFNTPINLIKTHKVVDWLMKLEQEVKISLSNALPKSISDYDTLLSNEANINPKSIVLWIQSAPCQVSILTTQIWCTSTVEAALMNHGKTSSELQKLHDTFVKLLTTMANLVLEELTSIDRKKSESLITELIRQRDVVDSLLKESNLTLESYKWQSQLKYYFDAEIEDPASRLIVTQAKAQFKYGFEYLGMPDRLVSTPLVDNCFLAMTQALEQKLGGSPFGPAGTGKTESVKALGHNLGKYVLVFCCDEYFDFQAIGRILTGICQVGAWGCFDEFNRLNEEILSSVSTQIEAIELGIKESLSTDTKSTIELVGKPVTIEDDTGIFITMNPEYKGRNTLPENLKKLFRSFSMASPDKEIIAEVILNSQGFVHAKALSQIVVPFFTELQNKLSSQIHYDFGLRALKNVLATSGTIKRIQLNDPKNDLKTWETSILLKCLRETVAPKLIAEDFEIMLGIEKQLFKDIKYETSYSPDLEKCIHDYAKENGLYVSDAWAAKILQLYQFQQIHHGIMLVGSAGCGKSSIWKALLHVLQNVEKTENVYHLIDPKVISKEILFGSLDSTTREWTDGLFTGILRRIVENLRGEDQKRHWIIFDGDVDPAWAENLNSVLDDNKMLTLPNGERISLPPNVRILFEVENLNYATPATVSRCGMIWFGPDVVNNKMQLYKFLFELKSNTYEDVEEDLSGIGVTQIQEQLSTQVQHVFDQIDIDALLETAAQYFHIMEFNNNRALNSAFAFINSSCLKLLLYMNQHLEFGPDTDQQLQFITKSILLSLVWSFTGDCSLKDRESFGKQLLLLTPFAGLDLDPSVSPIDYDVGLPSSKWELWVDKVPKIELETHSIVQNDVVVPTMDTMRHESLIYSLLNNHRPVVLCGPPGSGKTMTLFGALRKSPNLDVVGLNFSKATTPNLLIKSLEQHCEYKKTMNGTILCPSKIGRWLVVFCDEINLPEKDKYGTQRAISLLREMIEQNGFWSPSKKQWITLSRVQFVGACNPPTDEGRNELNMRFLRHTAVIFVDYPGETSLHQIYETFNSAILKSVPNLRGYASVVTDSMIEFYLKSQEQFTKYNYSHYIYSPRELTRWCRGIYEAIHPLDQLSLEGFVRVWAHEALRLFHDRLVNDDERKWTHDLLKSVSYKYFINVDLNSALKMPILYSNWLTKDYLPVDQDELQAFVKARMKTFCEEDLDKPLILYDDLLDHVLRIDRVLRQPQGHLILIGVSGSGKTTLSRFVAWMSGLRIFQLKTTRNYTQEDFDSDLRTVLKRAGTNGEKICFILDESNILETAFLERMNTLLANGEVPGLFEGDDFTTLMTACKEGASRQGFNLDSQDELYNWFTHEIIRNLHVIFTLNPPDTDLSSHAVASPALFNRCVLNWMGDWSLKSLYQVASSLTEFLPLDRSSFEVPETAQALLPTSYPLQSYRSALINAMVFIHKSVCELNKNLNRSSNHRLAISPGDFLDFTKQFVNLFHEKNDELEEQQRHFNIGVEKILDTMLKVKEMKANLAEKDAQLKIKDSEAQTTLQRMVEDQNAAERKRETSIKIQNELKIQEQEIANRREIVLNDLAKAEPAVIEAQRSVSNIKKQHLTELRSMANPPEAVKLALDSVCTILGYSTTSWKEIQGYVRKDDFISNIVNFDNESQMTPALRQKMENEFLSLPNFNFETVNRASKACGPLLQWVEAQVAYSSILERVGPLREEVYRLEQEAEKTKAQAQAIIDIIGELEQSIEKFKADYATLIAETQTIKAEISIVENKVKRSVQLIKSLSSEKKRWTSNIKEFESRKESLPGDVLLSAAFITYTGYYDQSVRKRIFNQWATFLENSGISFHKHNTISNYLASGEQRLQWRNSSLPTDDLYVENAIMINRYNRYPFIIDPTARIISFLDKQYTKKKLTITSFLDDAFIKHLESAIRFGNPILIQDAEFFDPVLSQVLNKEYKKTGGRILIELGNQDIDFSKDFQLFLLTRDPSFVVPPHISARTTVVNFSITRSSLENQTLNQVLRAERPDVEEKRLGLIKLQSEYKVHLRQLESQLLQALNDSEGNILDNENIIDTLERLKVESEEVIVKVEETDSVMKTIEEVMDLYRPLSVHCSKIFAILEKMYVINPFYQFSLEYFLKVFSSLWKTKSKEDTSSNTKNPADRVNNLISLLYEKTFRETNVSLLNKDKQVFLLLLSQAFNSEIGPTLLSKILSKTDSFSITMEEPNWISKVTDVLDEFTSLDFNSLNESEVKNALTFQQNNGGLLSINLWGDTVSEPLRRIYDMLLVKLFQPNMFLDYVNSFAECLLPFSINNSTNELEDVLRNHDDCKTPLALCASRGSDPTVKVEAILDQMNKKFDVIALGSKEGNLMADKAISRASQQGTWVLIQNVHLSPKWLENLEKHLHSARHHPDFRLLLTMQTTSRIPTTLLRMSRIVMFEPPWGIKASMQSSLKMSNAERISRSPIERSRLFFLLSWVHGIFQERGLFVPLGWKANYDFNDSDYETGLFVIDTWIDSIARNRSNIAPSAIPWESIKSLLADIVYGGKVEANEDQQVLHSIIDSVFKEEAYNLDFSLVSEDGGVPAKVPEGNSLDSYMKWVEQLPNREPLEWLGLKSDVEGSMKKIQGDEVASKSILILESLI